MRLAKLTEGWTKDDYGKFYDWLAPRLKKSIEKWVEKWTVVVDIPDCSLRADDRVDAIYISDYVKAIRDKDSIRDRRYRFLILYEILTKKTAAQLNSFFEDGREYDNKKCQEFNLLLVDRSNTTILTTHVALIIYFKQYCQQDCTELLELNDILTPLYSDEPSKEFVEEKLPEVVKGLPKVQVPGHMLDSMFVTPRIFKKVFGDDGAVEAEFKGGFQGLKLSLSEDRALHAIYMLLGKHNPQNGILEIKGSEFYDAYGLERIEKRGSKLDFSGYGTAKADEALDNLDKKQVDIIYKQKVRGKNDYDTNIIKERSCLLKIDYCYRVKTGNRVESRNKIPKERLICRLVTINPIGTRDMDTYYRVLPPPFDLHDAIKRFNQKHNKRTEEDQVLFIRWLHRHNPTKLNKIVEINIKGEKKKTLRIEINRYKLADQLKLDRLITKRERKKIQNKIDWNYKLAKALGYLLKVEKNKQGVKEKKDVLYLNAEKFHHLKGK